MIRFNCTGCGMLMQAMDSAAGRVSKCPGCGVHLVIPAAPPPAPPAPPPRRPPAPIHAAPPPVAPAVSPPAAPVPNAGFSLDDLLGDMTDSGGHSPAHGSSRAASGAKSGAHRKTGASSGARKDSAGKAPMSPAAQRKLGFAAIAAGGLAAALCWLPFAGAALGLIGAGLAMFAIVVGSSGRKKAPMGLPLAGAGISLAGMLAGVYFTFQSLNAPTAATQLAGGPAATAAPAEGAGATQEQAKQLSPLSISTQFTEAAVLALAGGNAQDAARSAKILARGHSRLAVGSRGDSGRGQPACR